MNDDMFSRLVAEDVKNRSSDMQKEFLHAPQMRDRWKRALIALSRNLEEQIHVITEDREMDSERYRSLGKDGSLLLAEAVSAYESRLSKIQRFKFFVDKRLDYVALLGEDESVSARVTFLESAIIKHRELMTQFDMEPTSMDIAVWAALDNKWEFDDIKFP